MEKAEIDKELLRYVRCTHKVLIVDVGGVHVPISKTECLPFLNKYREHIGGYDNGYPAVFFITVKPIH